ncbi:IS110 family transposase [Lentibacillus lipolyticus]|nr:IS110 family transposase [Lentibacillus lipolyticus]
MVHSLFNHIKGKNGSRWAGFIKETGIDHMLIVAIDAAKYTHKATICNFYGDVLVKPFEFDASETGFESLKSFIQQEKHEDIKEIVVGIETTGHYYEDVVRRCHQEGYQVRILNAATTAQERQGLLNWSKTDNLDLMVIVQTIINGKGTFGELPSGNVQQLQKLTRARRSLVKERTDLQNLIRSNMDQIFRETQGKNIWVEGKREYVKPFSKFFGKASRYIMRYYPHPSDILTLGAKGLRDISIRENLKIREDSIDILLKLAEDSISQPKQAVETEIFLLSQNLDQLDLLDQQISSLEGKIEDLFIQTEGAVLLSITGIGLVTGAELAAEMGDTADYEHAGQLIKMAGTNPIVKQSGWHKSTYHGISKQGRKTFRDITYQIGKSVAHNNPAMNKHYQKLKERGKHVNQAYIALGNRVIRLAFAMIRKQTLYQAQHENYVLYHELRKKLRIANVKEFYDRFVLAEQPSA